MGIVLTTPPDYVALSIALGILFLTTVVEPVVEACFHRVRAERAWRMIENKKPVEVTKYPFVSEALGDRGRWNAARVVAYLLFGLHVATTVLELSLDLAIRTDGPVDLLNRPPPVFSRDSLVGDGYNLTDWIVIMGENVEDIKEEGTLGNFKGSLEDGSASNTFRIDDRIVRGKTIFALWSTEYAIVGPGLFYNLNEGSASVEAIACTVPLRTASLYVVHDGSDLSGGEKWGDVVECESGPMPANTSIEGTNPPVIFMASSDGEAHYVVVEEDSSYPNFMYSVWRVASGIEIVFVYYIATNTRMVEAIITGIANGIVSGGGCVDLVEQFSVSNKTYAIGDGRRVLPFGEHPNTSFVESLDQVEPIVAGVQVSNLGVFCGALIMVVIVAAVVGGFCFRSRRALDVYDRDELIRAVSLPDGEGETPHGKKKAVKLFVRRTDAQGFSIIISDDGVYRGGCIGLANNFADRLKHRKKHPPAAGSLNVGTTVAAAGRRDKSIAGDALDKRISARSRFIAFDGVHSVGGSKLSPTARTESPALPRRRPTIVELIASPIPRAGGIDLSKRTLSMMGLRVDTLSAPKVTVADAGEETTVATQTESELAAFRINRAFTHPSGVIDALEVGDESKACSER